AWTAFAVCRGTVSMAAACPRAAAATALRLAFRPIGPAAFARRWLRVGVPRSAQSWVDAEGLEEYPLQPQDGGPWSPEVAQKGKTRLFRSACPFTVHRTASDNLPVYVISRNKRSVDITVVKKTRGDQEELRKELEYLCRCRVTYDKSGFLSLVGNHRRTIKAYLRSIGY
ncbi:unnamed protein product, partial [Polarella glacialis]